MTFSWIFHFSLIDFSKKIYENLFHKWAMPLGYMKVGMWSKKPKVIFSGRYCMLQNWPDYSDPTVQCPHSEEEHSVAMICGFRDELHDLRVKTR